MTRILIERQREWFEQVEPYSLYESEMEGLVVLYAPVLYPDYYVLPFKKTLESGFGSVKPDLVFISKDYGEWFIAEVEMGDHSLDTHVEPQIRRLADAVYTNSEADYLCERFPAAGLDVQALADLMTKKHPGILVIVNEPRNDWGRPLSRYGAVVVTWELFRSATNDTILRVNGDCTSRVTAIISQCTSHPVLQSYLEVHDPIALDLLPCGASVKIRFKDCAAEWRRIDVQGKVYLSPTGRTLLVARRQYEICRQSDNSLLLRESSVSRS